MFRDLRKCDKITGEVPLSNGIGDLPGAASMLLLLGTGFEVMERWKCQSFKTIRGEIYRDTTYALALGQLFGSAGCISLPHSALVSLLGPPGAIFDESRDRSDKGHLMASAYD